MQLRLKNVSDHEIRDACDILKPIVQSRDIAFILNDRPDLAAKYGCDGVHLGQDDESYHIARNCVGRNAIVGVTCHGSSHLAMLASEQGADYVAFGSFHKTNTKEIIHTATLELLRQWSEISTVPCVAIGGITPDNCQSILKAGADFIGVVSAVWNNPSGPAAAVREFKAAIASVV